MCLVTELGCNIVMALKGLDVIVHQIARLNEAVSGDMSWITFQTLFFDQVLFVPSIIFFNLVVWRRVEEAAVLFRKRLVNNFCSRARRAGITFFKRTRNHHGLRIFFIRQKVGLVFELIKVGLLE